MVYQCRQARQEAVPGSPVRLPRGQRLDRSGSGKRAAAGVHALRCGGAQPVRGARLAHDRRPVAAHR